MRVLFEKHKGLLHSRIALSSIVTQVLLIVIVLALIVLFWTSLKGGLFKKLSSTSDIHSCYTLTLEPLSCQYSRYIPQGAVYGALANSRPLLISYKRNAGSGNYGGVSFVVSDTQGNRQTVMSERTTLNELESVREVAFLRVDESFQPSEIELAPHLSPDNIICPTSTRKIACVPYNSPPICLEFYCDSELDSQDYFYFWNRFNDVSIGEGPRSCIRPSVCDSDDPCADVTGDGVVDDDDYVSFMDRYVIGASTCS